MEKAAGFVRVVAKRVRQKEERKQLWQAVLLAEHIIRLSSIDTG